MNTAITALRPRSFVRSLAPAKPSERALQRRIAFAWGLMVLNVLTFAVKVSVLPIPSSLGKLITQGSLPVALLIMLTVNRRIIIRPNVFLCLVSLLVFEAILTCLEAQYLKGTLYRTFRLAEFVAGLWLFTPFWGRRDLLLARCHLKAMAVVLGSVVLGLLVAPGHARNSGRLQGAIWPIPSTQVAHYAAVTFGLVTVLWFCGYMRGRLTAFAVVVSGAILILTHTRTALVGLIVGLLIAGFSLIVAKARVRRLFAVGGAAVVVAVLAFSGPIMIWLERGQGTSQLTGLSGRTNFWSGVLAAPRNKFQEIFGFGLSNAQFGGLPIDSNWLASYQQQGLFGVTVCAAMLVFLLVAAYFQPRGVQRALALFLITYCLVASFTEVGFTDASTYLLDLTVAASLLVPAAVKRSRDADRASPDGLRESVNATADREFV
jgi:hypothetical protein